jgi:hypothetical protein
MSIDVNFWVKNPSAIRQEETVIKFYNIKIDTFIKSFNKSGIIQDLTENGSKTSPSYFCQYLFNKILFGLPDVF